MKYKYDVFLSFSVKDIDFVKAVWEELKKSRLNVFFSEETLKKNIGRTFDDAIENALEQSKDFFLICTPNSMQSEWVEDEYKTFYHEIYKKNKKERRFIILEGKRFKISLVPLRLRRFQRAKSVTEIIDILTEKDIQHDDQKMMAPSEKGDGTEKERKDTLWQIMENRMVLIPAGAVLMKDKDSGNEFTEKINSFLLDKFPVTQDLYEKVMGEEKNRSRFRGGDRPVEYISWFEVVEFCNRLSGNIGLKRVYTIDRKKVTADWNANGFRLLTEKEWEYACRAGTIGEWYGEIDKIAWYKDNSNGSTQVVGKKEPNPWGLYDMLGNVWEWCWDRYEKYPGQRKKACREPENVTYRVRRGGSWFNLAEQCSSAHRASKSAKGSSHNLGMRLARSL